MDAVDWWARGMAVASLAIAVVTVRSTWRWRGSHGLLAVHEALRRLKSAALEHLRVQAGEAPTEQDVTDLREDAKYLVERVGWKDVREAAERLFAECDTVMLPRVRDLPIERKDAVRRAIQDAFDTASATVGARADKMSLRGLVAGQWRRVRS